MQKMKACSKQFPQTEIDAKTNNENSHTLTEEEQVAPLNVTVAELLQDQPIYVNSIGAGLLGLDQGSILREMKAARRGHIRFLMSKPGGQRSREEAIKLMTTEDDETLDRAIKDAFSTSVEQITWLDLDQIYQRLPELAKEIWDLVKDQAAEELASGNRMAATLETVEWQREAWMRAQFLAIREGYVKEWQPRGAIENSLIDMMAQTFSEYLHWSAEVHKRSTAEPIVIYDSEEERRKATASGHWLPPRLSEHHSIEHAMQMMDRFNRLFLRTLRQLRDLRRYTPAVTINNPQQVNIAADGGQQVNLTKT